MTSPVFDLCPNSGVEGSIAEWLTKPPGYTALRINTRISPKNSIIDTLNTHLEAQSAEKGSGAFVVEEHASIPDVLLVRVVDQSLTVHPEPSQIIVDTMCGAAVLRGSDVFAPGVIGADIALRAGTMVSVWADLEGRCLRGATAVYTGRKQFLGNGEALLDRAVLFKHESKVRGVAVAMTRPVYSSPRFHTLPEDLFFPQNLPSILTGHVLSPREGELVLDMCAAPGGKTTHIASLMNDSGRVIALDRSQGKVEKIRKNSSMWGLTCIRAFVCDSAKNVLTESNAPQDSGDIGAPPYPPETFDKVLVDAPCSGLGQRPRLGELPDIKQVQSYPPYQRRILRNAISLLRPGGTLVYSTCTLPVEENEGNVAWILRTFPVMSLVEQCPLLGQRGCLYDGLCDEDRGRLQRFDFQDAGERSAHDTDTIGFFIAKFRKD